MANNFRQLNNNISAGDGAPADGDALATNLAAFPIDYIYIDSTTGTVYARNAENAVAADWVSQAGGGGGTTIYTGDGSLAGNRIVDLDGNTLEFKQGANNFLSIDPTADSEQSILRAYNTTDDDNYGQFHALTSATDATAKMLAAFNEVKLAQIQAFADASSSSITSTADAHIYVGVQEFADNAAAITGGLAVGTLYRTGDTVKIVH